ncbi:hypothetical protein GCM10028815_08580 [Mariniluteicoccus flavus]
MAAVAMPTTGTSIENGATTPAGWRAISQVQMPEPTMVPSTMVYASPTHAGIAAGASEVARLCRMAVGPSNTNDRRNIGRGGTTDIHSVRCSGFGGAAKRLDRLPSAQPRAPRSTRT